MARKTLLNEAEIRRFMKLANMSPVGDGRINERYPPGQRDEEELDVAAADVEMGPEGEDVEAMDVEMDVEEPAPEAPMDDMGDDMGAGTMVSVDDFMAALETALEDVTGEEVNTVVGLEADAEAPEEGGDELEPEMPELSAEPEGMDVGAEEEEVEFSMQGRLVNKVAQRVAARRVKEDRKAKLTDQLTERIFKRLTQK